MAAQYSPRHFFRNTPIQLLQSYFTAKQINIDADFDTLKENDVETLFTAFLALTDTEQTQAEADFKTINSLASEAGVQALVDEALYFEDNVFIEHIAAIEGFHAKVLWAFINKPEYWHIATMFLHADNVSASYWKKRNGLLLADAIEDSAIEKLSQAISSYFYEKEARGKHCKIEVYSRNNKEYFFAYPEDYAQTNNEWVSENLENRATHPAFEIIFVYCADEKSLDIYAPRNSKAVPELQRLFAKHILHLDSLPDGAIDKRVYELDTVAEPDFDFKIATESGIDSVVVTHLRLSFKHQIRKRLTLEADTKKSRLAVYDLLAELDIPPYYISQIGVKVLFAANGAKRQQTKRFNITHPNSCALNYDGNDLKIREMLVASGIEPHALDKA
ncbi:MAG: hypothetical protein ACI9LM_005291 [Alteromonadaceae bacterium]|jgi:hypothetical protein